MNQSKDKRLQADALTRALYFVGKSPIFCGKEPYILMNQKGMMDDAFDEVHGNFMKKSSTFCGKEPYI